MQKPGYYYIELDDGSGADRHTEQAEPPFVGQLIYNAYGRTWRVDRLGPSEYHAHAVPHE
jgi:hypothetical protein